MAERRFNDQRIPDRTQHYTEQLEYLNFRIAALQGNNDLEPLPLLKEQKPQAAYDMKVVQPATLPGSPASPKRATFALAGLAADLPWVSCTPCSAGPKSP